jgi:biopolymer transport protein ExbD
MGRFRSNSSSSGIPKISTASLPDIVFMLLFFFMTATTMKEVTYQVKMTFPQATELTKLENKSLVKYIYIGEALDKKKHGVESCIQLNDQIVEGPKRVGPFINSERESMKEEDQSKMMVALKIDKNTKMGIVTDVKTELRNAQALRITYTALQKQNR